ncbi:MAG TPA: nuclear transport factor 2 family protein [Vicinamibacterales bacterium]
MVEPGTDGLRAIEALEQRLARAWVERDRAFIENLLAPEWRVTDPSGRVLTRQQVLDETFSSSDRQIDSMTVDDLVVKMLGTTAIATGRTRAAGRFQGQPVTVALRFTDVFHLVDGAWKVVVSHGTLIGP